MRLSSANIHRPEERMNAVSGVSLLSLDWMRQHCLVPRGSAHASAAALPLRIARPTPAAALIAPPTLAPFAALTALACAALTMSRRQRPRMVRHAIQVILERPDLRAWIVEVLRARRLAAGHEPREIEVVDGEHDGGIGPVPEAARVREALELDQQDGGEADEGEGFCRFALLLAVCAYPAS